MMKNTYRLFEIFILGVLSGMPLAIIVTTIAVWLKENDIPIEIITTFVAAKLFYSLKFIKAPFIEYIRIPYLSRLGKRKSWIFLCIAMNSIILYLMSLFDPKVNLSIIYCLTLGIGFFSAISGINKDAFLIEQLDSKLLPTAYATLSLGFRIGIALVTLGSFYYVSFTNDWNAVFKIMAIIFCIGAIFITYLNETTLTNNSLVSTSGFFNNYIKNPLVDFLNKENSILILLAIIFSKMGEAMQAVISSLFYLHLGYSKMQIANITTIYGILVIICGTYFAPIIINKYGNLRSLILIGFIQGIANLSFIWLSYQPVNIVNLGIIITLENFSLGLGGTVILSYLGILCNKKYSAVQFALLSSICSLCNTTITMFAGTIVNVLNWSMYFIFTTSLLIISILIAIYLNNKNKVNNEQV